MTDSAVHVVEHCRVSVLYMQMHHLTLPIYSYLHYAPQLVGKGLMNGILMMGLTTDQEVLWKSACENSPKRTQEDPRLVLSNSASKGDASSTSDND